MTKKDLRKAIRNLNLALSKPERQDYSISVTQQILASPLWRKSNVVLLFSSLPDEMDTSHLVECAIKEGKQIILPVISGDDTLELYYYHPQHLTQGRYNILEPDPRCDKKIEDLSKIDLALIPGIAFTESGHRLGRGKGYYDRLLPQLSCPCYGVAYPHQVLPSLPLDPWDKQLNGVFFPNSYHSFGH